jgi:hypothetical protein
MREINENHCDVNENISKESAVATKSNRRVVINDENNLFNEKMMNEESHSKT